METKIMRVVQQGDVLTVQSTKSEGGMLKKTQHHPTGDGRKIRKHLRSGHARNYSRTEFRQSRTCCSFTPLPGSGV